MLNALPPFKECGREVPFRKGGNERPQVIYILYSILLLATASLGLGRPEVTPVDTEPLPRLAERAADDGKFGGGSRKLLA